MPPTTSKVTCPDLYVTVFIINVGSSGINALRLWSTIRPELINNLENGGHTLHCIFINLPSQLLLGLVRMPSYTLFSKLSHEGFLANILWVQAINKKLAHSRLFHILQTATFHRPCNRSRRAIPACPGSRVVFPPLRPTSALSTLLATAYAALHVLVKLLRKAVFLYFTLLGFIAASTLLQQTSMCLLPHLLSDVTDVVDDVGGDGDATGNCRHLRDLFVDGGRATYGETCAGPSTEYVKVSAP
ncbi:hypothetical protein HG530_014078 [Fusarium avenaceum]|nr:hypothetical protein HG530_014078 [Fusarium avenaceum]